MTNTFIGPAILIFLGAVFLLNNFGILPWDVWQSLWKFWPAILILIGAEILLGKSASIRTFIILAGLIFLVPIALSYNPLTNNPLNTDELKVEETLGTATKVKLQFDFPTTNIKLNSLDSDSNFLTQGKITYSEASKKPEISKEESAGVTTLKMSQALEGKLPFISNLKTRVDLSLTSVVPVEVILHTGASNIEFDFTDLRVEYLEVNSGASNITIKFAEDFSQKVLIKSGASSVILEFPEKLEAKITLNSQVKSVDAPDRFNREENTYKSAGYDKAASKADVEIIAVAGSVVIK